jgi:hypothetical protein
VYWLANRYLTIKPKAEAIITNDEKDAVSSKTTGGLTMNNDNEINDNPWSLESGLDVLMLLLYAEGPSGKVGEPIEGITRLDKIMYLLSQSKEFSVYIDKNYDFQADNFGPFAPELFDDIQALKQECIIEAPKTRKTKDKIETVDEESVEKVLDEAPGMNISWKKYPLETYELTPLGIKIASELYSNLSPSQKEELKKIKKTFSAMSLRNLLYYVYSTAPSKMLEKSKIKEDVLGK